MSKLYDVIIAGGGPAGLSAALYALRAEKSVLVLEKNGFGGQIATSPRVENYPGVMSVSGAEFSDNLLSQVTGLGGDIDLGEVTGISVDGERRVVATTDGDYSAKAVIIASGARHRHLGLPREDELIGRGVSYCAICDGSFFKGRPVAVCGGGDAALQDALLLADTCSTVYLIHRREEFRGEAANAGAVRARSNIRIVTPCRVTGLTGETELKAVELENLKDGSKKLLPVDGLFVAIGFEPENAPFKNVAALDDAGWLDVGEDCLTATPGVFAAGDCRRKGVRQLATAVGDGAAAAVAACRYIDSL